MDWKKISALACCVLAPSAWNAQAGVENQVPSCYAANQIEPADHLGYSRLIYVLVDQTVGWNTDLEQSILDNLNANLTPGTKFVIAEFSAFSQGRYLDVVDTGVIENPMPVQQFDNTPIEKSKIFNACLADQRPYAVALADRGLLAVLQNSTGSLNHSDILSALQSVSEPSPPTRHRTSFCSWPPMGWKIPRLPASTATEIFATSTLRWKSSGLAPPGFLEISPARGSLSSAARLPGQIPLPPIARRKCWNISPISGGSISKNPTPNLSNSANPPYWSR
jgi:hypothetical protein